jgi:purine nucleoside phosphorylase
MSTIPEAFAARRAGLRVAVVSLVTNLATGIGDLARLDHEEVVARAAVGARDLGRLLRGTIGGGV